MLRHALGLVSLIAVLHLLPVSAPAGEMGGDGTRCEPVLLTQVISREHPALEGTGQRLSIGRDGKVYVASGDYVLRLNRDGSGRLGSKVQAAMWNVAANADGSPRPTPISITASTSGVRPSSRSAPSETASAVLK